MIAATLDASVLAAGFAGADQTESIPGKVVRLWQRRVFQLVVSDHILAELERALAKPYFRRRLTPVQAEGAVRLVRTKASSTALTVTVAGVAWHWEDDLVLATAVSAKVRFLVTGDRRLLAVGQHRGVRMVTPRAFLDLLNRQSAAPQKN